MWDPMGQIGLDDIAFGAIHRARASLADVCVQLHDDGDTCANISQAFALVSIASSLFRIEATLRQRLPKPDLSE